MSYVKESFTRKFKLESQNCGYGAVSGQSQRVCTVDPWVATAGHELGLRMSAA